MKNTKHIDPSVLLHEAQLYLNTLCHVKPNRRTGSVGNREATAFFAKTVQSFGYEIDMTSFNCLDYISRGATLTCKNETFNIITSPYSLGCDITAEVKVVNSVEELEAMVCSGKILLMRGEICKDQLMPQDFPFYFPDEHKKIYSLLKEIQPGALITATKKNEMVGAIDPFPLINDGTFNIPSVYCKDDIGEKIGKIAEELGGKFILQINAKRIPAQASNVVARKNLDASQKIVICAHIDAYENSPGANDNASGVVVLLLLAKMLAEKIAEMNLKIGIELVAFNGEDHYSAGGQVDYLDRYGASLGNILLAINLDDVGYIEGKTAYSYYNVPNELKEKIEQVFSDYSHITMGPQWFQGDHMIFVQQNIPTMALTDEMSYDLMRTHTHTDKDSPEIVNCVKLIEIAKVLKTLIIGI